MNNSVSQFNSRIQEIKDLTSTIDQIDGMTTNALDISDLYRSQIVLAVSALDHFIHEFVLEEMMEIYNGRRTTCPAFNRFPIPISTVQGSIPSNIIISSHIRQKHSWLSFQDPDKIADAIRLVSDLKLWEEIAPSFGLNAGDLKAKLKLIVDRRNKIAHESDLDPSNPGVKWPISTTDVRDVIDFIEKVANEIFNKIK
ncbi:HEPN domain-containing protein [Muricauda sp. SCSIO 64092]|uniref:HEPN domain-containing protein n=1 Tax=Allomuricauda sp. SCSIO 64092 TaxID=2908842 RepID=UPI001FF4A753|nr:HEPN domain-containing protein [Muricauda sp. SCSIO 64092]UOY04985.1 HEPN domain-containing protein [Muricauda sp. SCSIO 64092]